MNRRYRLLSVHLMAVLLPCAVIGLLGYKWLQLERDAETRRGKEAAESEAAAIRSELVEHLGRSAATAAQAFGARAAATTRFAPPPETPDPIVSAYLLRSDGGLLYPDYEAAYRQTIHLYQAASARPQWQQITARADALEARGQIAEARRVLQELPAPPSGSGLEASLLLRRGRLALLEKHPGEAESHAQQILQCCAGARDEYGIPFSLYAATQLVSTWEAQGAIRNRFPNLASRLTALIESGHIGHRQDIPAIAALVGKAAGQTSASGAGRQPASAESWFGPVPGATTLLHRAEQGAARITEHIETGRRLEKWIAGSALVGRGGSRFSLATWWKGESPQLVGVYRAESGNLLAALFHTGRIAAWVSARAGARGRFEALLSAADKRDHGATVDTMLLPEAPGFHLSLRAAVADPATQQRRQRLFAGALAAALLLVLLAGYFALRDASRELQLAGLRSHFVAGVTHELKTPLTSIRMLAETLRLGRARDPAVADRLLATIVDESERLGRLLDNVLTFARIEKGARSYRPVEIELGEAVGSAVRRFDYILKQEGFRLVTETNSRAGRLRVRADSDALDQALLNLLANAVKYSGTAREIRLAIHAGEEKAEIRVTDSGIGIPRAEQRRIFEGFYRAPGAARETTGAGLGLALVQHFAQAHGGSVTVASEPGKGSTFCLTLPLLSIPQSHHVSDSDRRG